MSISCSMLCVSLVTIQMGRRESLFGRVPPVVEVPSVKQRRNSLSIPFFSHPTPKQGEGPKLLDDNLPVSLVVMVMHVTLTTSCQLHCIRLIISLYTIWNIYLVYLLLSPIFIISIGHRELSIFPHFEIFYSSYYVYSLA